MKFTIYNILYTRNILHVHIYIFNGHFNLLFLYSDNNIANEIHNLYIYRLYTYLDGVHFSDNFKLILARIPFHFNVHNYMYHDAWLAHHWFPNFNFILISEA